MAWDSCRHRIHLLVAPTHTASHQPADPSANLTAFSKFDQYDELADAAGALLRKLEEPCGSEAEWRARLEECSLRGVAERFGGLA